MRDLTCARSKTTFYNLQVATLCVPMILHLRPERSDATRAGSQLALLRTEHIYSIAHWPLSDVFGPAPRQACTPGPSSAPPGPSRPEPTWPLVRADFGSSTAGLGTGGPGSGIGGGKEVSCTDTAPERPRFGGWRCFGVRSGWHQCVGH